MLFISISTIKMSALRTILNFSDSHVLTSQPMMTASSTPKVTHDLPTVAMVFDNDRLAVAHTVAVMLVDVTATVPAACHVMINVGIRR